MEEELFFRRTGIRQAEMEVLRRLPLFSGLSPDGMRTLLQHATVRMYPANNILFLHGDPADQFFVLFDGWVKLFRETEDGKESVIAVVTKGESFAEAAIFDQTTFPVTAATVSQSRLMIIPASSFLGRIREDGGLALNILAAMSRRNRQLVRRLEQMTVRSSLERLAVFLLDLCGPQNGACEIHLPHDKSLVAARLGMQPETLSRSLAKLRNIGIETSADGMMIPDVVALRDIASGREG